MPAEGAMQTRIAAPIPEPLSLAKTAVAGAGVRRDYRTRRGVVTALDGVDLDLREREVLAVVGPSGCGKSTLLELIAGLQEPDAGSVTVSGADERLDACAYMPQRDLLLPWRTALANAALALECRGRSRAEARRQAAPLFERFGLAEVERSYPGELSGGMRQRVAFLRTLLAGRPVLLLDEPFASLDSITRGQMQEWLGGGVARGPPPGGGGPHAPPGRVVLVTHATEEALFLADRVAVLSPRPGRVIEELDVPFPRPRNRRETI